MSLANILIISLFDSFINLILLLNMKLKKKIIILKRLTPLVFKKQSLTLIQFKLRTSIFLYHFYWCAPY